MSSSGETDRMVPQPSSELILSSFEALLPEPTSANPFN